MTKDHITDDAQPAQEGLLFLASELEAFHDCADGDVQAGNGHFRLECVSESEQQRLNLRAVLRDAAKALRIVAAQPPAAPVETDSPVSKIQEMAARVGCEFVPSKPLPPSSAGTAAALTEALNHLRTAPLANAAAIGTIERLFTTLTEPQTLPVSPVIAGNGYDPAEFRKLQDIIDNQADQILDLHEVLKSAYALHEFIAGAYILSLADFRYLNVVSTKIKAELPDGDVTRKVWQDGQTCPTCGRTSNGEG